MTPRFGLVCIVKDEARRIDAFLASARRYCGAATIVDTGSTDGTLERVREIWPEAQVEEVAWDGFGPSRSRSLTLAWGTADWLLALDADMTIDIDPAWEPDPAVDAYTVAMGNDAAFTWRLPLVLRGDVAWKSVGRCHAYTARADGAPMRQEPTDAVQVRYQHKSNAAKAAWQLDLLLRDLAERPDDPRTVFYLAQTHRELGHTAEARDLYLRRAQMGGYEPERWYAMYRAALLADWPCRAGEMLAAWDARPDRMEPVAALLRDLNARSMHRSAWAIAESARMGLPTDDLFVHRDAWPQVLAEMAIAGWHTGHRERAATLARLALDDPYLTPQWREATQRNLVLEAATPGGSAQK